MATCQFAYPNPSGSPHLITAVYSGDGTFNTSTSTQISQAVGQTATTTALVSSQNPSAPTDPVTFTATVSTASGTPTGTVDFYDGTVIPANLISGCTPFNGTVAAHAHANTLIEATHSITAQYSGDAVFSRKYLEHRHAGGHLMHLVRGGNEHR